MNNLTQVKQTITSIEISNLIGKPHNDLMKAIRSMEETWVKIGQGKFSLTYYKDQWNRNQPQYELNKKECLYIATKFNDEARAKLILRWEELETSKMIDFSDANTVLQLAQNWKVEQDKRIAAEKQVRQLAPKAEFMDRVMDTDEKIDIGQAAKILELPFGRNTLFQKLREKGIFFKNRNEPRQEYVQRGYFVLKEKLIERTNHKNFTVIKVLVTQKGLNFLNKVFEATPSSKQLSTIE